jgi:hypothetical protein
VSVATTPPVQGQFSCRTRSFVANPTEKPVVSLAVVPPSPPHCPHNRLAIATHDYTPVVISRIGTGQVEVTIETQDNNW